MTEKQKSGATERKYFEVFGDTVQLLNVFKMALAASLFLNVVFILLLRRAASMPPAVIRVDSHGNPAIVETMAAQNISGQEIQNFVTYFIEYWRGWDFYKYDDNFSRVWTMMSGELQQNCARELGENKIVDKIVSGRLKHKITLTEIRITASDKRYVVVEVAGTRSEGNYENKDAKDVRFMATLSLKIVPRKLSLWGLQADSYVERVFDK